jgi:hypothetical protein
MLSSRSNSSPNARRALGRKQRVIDVVEVNEACIQTVWLLGLKALHSASTHVGSRSHNLVAILTEIIVGRQEAEVLIEVVVRPRHG